MTRRFIYALATVLVFASSYSAGQRPGTPPPQPPAHPAEPAGDDEITQFTHAVELQATAHQAYRFNQFAQSTANARSKAQLIATRGVSDVLHAADPLLEFLDDVQWEGTRFLASFTPQQKSGLKPLTRRLAKTNKEISNQTKTLQTARATADENDIVAVAGRLDEALAKYEKQQRAIAREMAIPTEESGE